MRGFTVVEMAAVLAIAVVLAGIAMPAITATLRSVQLSSATNDLLGGLLLARSESAKRGTRVVMCKSGDGGSCANDGGWEQGWIVFADSNNNAVREVTETVIEGSQALRNGLRVTGNLRIARYVSYSPNGATQLPAGSFQAGTFILCRACPDKCEARQIVLALGGRPRVQKTVVPSCA